MAMYRTYFLSEDDHIRAVEDIEAQDAEEAVRQSLAILEQRPQHHAVEVWQGGRRIYPPPTALPQNGAAEEAEPTFAPVPARPLTDTVEFLLQAAGELRRVADRAPETAAELRRIAEQSDALADDLLAHIPPRLRARLGVPGWTASR
jgi:hypothetical protein